MSTGFDPPTQAALRNSTLRDAQSLSRRRSCDQHREPSQVLSDSGQNKLILAPRGPGSRSQPSFRMRFKCANLISIFLRSCRDRSKPSVPANDRATSRACSWISCGILRDEAKQIQDEQYEGIVDKWERVATLTNRLG